MTEKKTRLPSLKNLDKKKEKVETEKVNKLLPNIPRLNITELNEQIHAEAKLVYNKIGIAQGNQNKNTNPEWEIRLEGKIEKTSESAMDGRTCNDISGWKYQKRKANKSESTTGRDKSKDIGEIRETQKILGQRQAIQTNHNLLE